MAHLKDQEEIFNLYDTSKTEADEWRIDYPEYKRLADNGLLQDDDEYLPETNDGSLSASLFKLPKRIVSSKSLRGRATAEEKADAWVTELANIVWEDKIIKNANTQAPFHRKWKDAVRKAAIYGSAPIINLFVENGNYTGSDFIVEVPENVTLEAGKISDHDSDVIFWDVYYSEQQVKNLRDRAKRENKQKTDTYSKWYVEGFTKVLESKQQEEDEKKQNDDKPRRKGYKFTIVYQRGVKAPFFMLHRATKCVLREWENPDPTGDIPVHFLYCYQDFENPYGIGIVKLAGGTQNVLDIMRKYDVYSTALGFRPPISIGGDTTGLDADSLVYAADAQWIVGRAQVKREEISNQVYQQLPSRIAMYKTSLNQHIPTGDTSISGAAGDPQYSKTPAGIKFQAQNLSIDDEDFKDNLYITYSAVARSMINTHFANMQGTDIMKLTDEQREVLSGAGLEFPVDDTGAPTNDLEIIWDNSRANFYYEIDPEQDKTQDDEKRLDGLLKVLDLIRNDENINADLMQSGKRLNKGELLSETIRLISDSDKIIEDVAPEDQAIAQQQMMAGQQAPQTQEAAPQPTMNPEYVNAIMQQYGVDEGVAMAMVEAEMRGYQPDEILSALRGTMV